jgi:hypothetical protein
MRERESMERYKKAREKRKGEGQGLSVMILASKVGDITDERNKNLMMSKTLGRADSALTGRKHQKRLKRVRVGRKIVK